MREALLNAPNKVRWLQRCTQVWNASLVKLTPLLDCRERRFDNKSGLYSVQKDCEKP